MNPSEIKALRKSLKLNQTEFGEKIGASLRTIQTWEKGDAQPSAQKLMALIALSEGISVLEPKTEYLTNTNGNQFYEKSPGNLYVRVPLLPFEAYASYAETLEVGKPIKDLDVEEFAVDQYGKGNYMAFKVRGDSMNDGKLYDTPNGATLLGRELGRHHWMDGFNPNALGWVILCKQNIFHKDIVDFNKETGEITCHSRNSSPEYSDFTLHLNDVYQIFKVIKQTI